MTENTEESKETLNQPPNPTEPTPGEGTSTETTETPKHSDRSPTKQPTARRTTANDRGRQLILLLYPLGVLLVLSDSLIAAGLIELIDLTMGIDESGVAIIRSAFDNGVADGYLLQGIYLFFADIVRETSLANYSKFFGAIASIPARRIRQGICLGLVFSCIVISLITMQHGTVLHAISASITILISALGFWLGSFCIRKIDRHFNLFTSP